MRASLLSMAVLPSSEAIRRKAQEVVARPDYNLETAVDERAFYWWLEVLRWLLTPLRLLFRALEGLPEVLRWLIVSVLVLLCLALIAHIVWTFVAAFSGTPTRLRRQGEPGKPEADPEQLEREAETISAGGDYIQAIRLLFRASLLRLERSEKRKFRPGFTNRELLNRYRTSPMFHPLKYFVETIDAKWYGLEPCLATDYTTCREEHTRLRALIPQQAHAVST